MPISQARYRATPPVRPTLQALAPSDMTPGREINLGDFIVEQVRQGIDPATAAGTVGVTPAELQAWMREGTLAFARLNAGAHWDRDFTAIEQDVAVFADKMIRARSAHIARLAVIAEQAARGGLEKTTTKKRKVDDRTVEEWTTVEHTLPDTDMVKWKLERLEPAVYGQRATLNLSVTDLTDTDTVADVVEARMMEVAAALIGAIDTTATESPGESDEEPPQFGLPERFDE